MFRSCVRYRSVRVVMCHMLNLSARLRNLLKLFLNTIFIALKTQETPAIGRGFLYFFLQSNDRSIACQYPSNQKAVTQLALRCRQKTIKNAVTHVTARRTE